MYVNSWFCGNTVMVINISIHDSVKKNNNAFELIIYVQKDFHGL